MQKTKIEIINETRAWYEGDPSRRSMSPYGICQYLADDGRTCAVGRCLIDPNVPNGSVFDVWDDRSIDEDMKPEYRGHSRSFWEELQNFHDTRVIGQIMA